jgi:voltage-gated potassium channel
MTLETWERRTDWPMTILAMAFLGIYAWPILDTRLDTGVVEALSAASIVIWVVFGVDYGIRVSLAPRRGEYVRRHWIDLGLLLLPVLRPLRALRAVLALGKIGGQASMSFRGRAVLYVACAVPLVVFVAALALLNAERSDPEANITSFEDALWWGCTTVTTVGYGDRFPVTREGRLVGVGLMVAGIALLGVITAALASWFVERIEAVEEAEEQTHRDLATVLAEVRMLRDDLERETRGQGHSPGQAVP